VTTLHDQLEAAVCDVRADLTALTEGARRRGLAQRRRRRTLAAVGTAAAAVLVGGAAWGLVSPAAPDRPAPVATDPGGTATSTATPTAAAVATVPLDGRSAAGVLAELVARLGPTPRGSGGQDGGGEPYARLLMARGALVEVNVQHAERYSDPDGLEVGRRDDGKDGTDRWVALYVDHARGVRVSVAVVAREGLAPPLDPLQLETIAKDAAWAFEVPAPAPPAPSPYTSLD
jgi:hypothetical protein